MAKLKIQENFQIELLCTMLTDNTGLKERLAFQLFLWASSSDILLAQATSYWSQFMILLEDSLPVGK